MGAELNWGRQGIYTEEGALVHWPSLWVGNVTFQLCVTDQYESGTSTGQRSGGHQTRAVEFLSYQVGNRDHAFDHVPYEDDRFAWAAGRIFDVFGDATQVSVLVRGDQDVGGDKVPVRREELRPIETATVVGPIWCPVANMKAERPYGPGGEETKRGSRHFAPGAKLYCFPALWGDGYEKIQVVGHHRASHRYVMMVVNSTWLTNWRVELVYSPHVIRELWPGWDGTVQGKERAQQIVEMIRERETARDQS